MKNNRGYVIVSHSLFLALIILILLPGEKKVQPVYSLLTAVVLMECVYLWKLVPSIRRGQGAAVPSGIISILWGVLILWEGAVTKLDCMHPVLYPAPENVFHVFTAQYQEIAGHVLSTMELLLLSLVIGMTAGVILGAYIGWNRALSEVLYPIVNVLAPIPSIVYAPYIISLMPSFRSASAMVIALGTFFPLFLSMVNRVQSMDQEIIDSARMLNVNNRSMVGKIILPYLVPGVIAGLKVTLTTSFMLLMFAEMMGATKGLGYFIVNYNTYGNYTNVIAGIIVIGVLVSLLNWLVTLLQRYAIRWKPI